MESAPIISSCLSQPMICANQLGMFAIDTLGAEAAPMGFGAGTGYLGKKLTQKEINVLAEAMQKDKEFAKKMTAALTDEIIKIDKNISYDTNKNIIKLLENNANKAGKGTSAKISPENQKYVDILSPEAKQHILYGDGPTSGGHMYPGNPGKSTFPKDWSADKIVHEIGDIATSPNTQWYAQSGTGGLYTKAGNPARWAAYEIRDGVRIRVIYEPANGKIITAFPDKAPVPSHYKPIK